jgi:hypothetical protein
MHCVFTQPGSKGEVATHQPDVCFPADRDRHSRHALVWICANSQRGRLSKPPSGLSTEAFAATIQKCLHSLNLSGEKCDSTRRATIAAPRHQTKRKRKISPDQSDATRLQEFLDCAPRGELKESISLTKDTSRLTTAGGASAVPAGGGSSLLLSGGLGISLPTL